MRFAVRSVIIVLLGSCACSSGQDFDDDAVPNVRSSAPQPRSINQDVSILKQIHRHNEDGSYTYGYEGSDGSFKIETKLRSGEVSGKYGYVDDVGKLRVVEYGANKYGFQPSGDGITVPPPTLVELKQDNDDDVDERDNFEEPAQRPVKRPQPSSGKPRKPSSFQARPDGFFQQQQQVQQQQVQQQQQQQPIPNSAVRSIAAEFDSDDGEWAAPTRSARPPPPVANRPKPMLPPVAGSFAAAPEPQQGPSGSYHTETNFGSKRPSGNGNRNKAPVVVADMYQTFEEPQEPVQVVPVKQTRKNGGAGSARAQAQAFWPVASNPRRTSSGVLDQLAEQYALPETGSPVSHDVSFGLDH